MAMKFSEIKPKIKNLGGYNTLADVKRDGLRVAYNRVDDSYWLIELEFLRPVIKSPRECRSIVVKPEDLKYKILCAAKAGKNCAARMPCAILSGARSGGLINGQVAVGGRGGGMWGSKTLLISSFYGLETNATGCPSIKNLLYLLAI